MSQPTISLPGPLSGIRVLEFGSFVAGPWAGQLMADMGADVVKVEPPSGDPWRHASPFAPNESRVFVPLNRGVRSICLDLKQESGRAVLRRLFESADGIISNNRRDTALKLGIDYQTVSRINPQLVYVDITAYGSEGPRADMPGFDLILQGYTGAVTSEGKISKGQPEVVWSSSYIDFSTGYAAANGILAGIIGRGKTGKGQLVSTSLLGNAIAMQTLRIADIEGIPAPARTWHEEVYPGLKKRGASYEEIQISYQQAVRPMIYRCYYRAYKTLDGGLTLGTLAVHARARLLDVFGLEDPRVTDPEYDDSPPEATELGLRLTRQFEEIFAGKRLRDRARTPHRAQDPDIGTCVAVRGRHARSKVVAGARCPYRRGSRGYRLQPGRGCGTPARRLGQLAPETTPIFVAGVVCAHAWYRGSHFVAIFAFRTSVAIRARTLVSGYTRARRARV